MKLLDNDRIKKIVAGEGGIPVKKFVEDDEILPQYEFARFKKHHQEETNVLYKMLQEACQMIEGRDVLPTDERILRLETRLFNLTEWLSKRAGKDCHNCGGQNDHDRCDNEPQIDDFAQMAQALNKST